MMKPLHWLAAAALSLGLSASAAAQNGTIRGTVSSTKGETLPGVSVKVEGKSYAVVTNAGGAYQLSVPAGTYKLVVSGMGYKGANKTGTVLAGKDLLLNFILSEDVSVLDDVVVIGYGQSSTKDLTGSLVSVKSRSFQRGAFSTPEQLIVGKTPGVRITSNSGQPGAGSRIRIRGGSSLNASNDPLVVIDGLPADGLGLINPADIESFTILKDASAAAIYGSRAANGVILVTTKKGAAGKAFNADLNVVYSVRNNRNQVNVLSADEFANAINTYGTKAQIARLATAPGWAKVTRNGTSTFDSIIPTDSATRTNWQDVIYQTGMVQDVNIAFTGGIKNLPYRLSLGRYHETGVLRRSELARYSASLNASPELIKGKLKANFAGKLINSTQNYSNTGAIGTAVTFDPTRPVYSGDTSFLGGYFEWIRNNEPNGLSPKNPLGLIEQRTDIGHNTRLLGNVLFDYKATADDKLHLYLNVGGEFSNTNGEFFTPASAAAQWFQGGEKGQYASTRTNRLLEAYFNYKTNLSANIKTDLIGGYSFQHWSTTSPTFPVLNADGSDTMVAPAANDFFTENALMSFYGRWNVNAYDKYLFTFTLRQDGSSRFSKESRWGLFPSAAVAHNLLKEGFLAGNTTFSTLKWRAGWGIVGQQDIFNDYAYIPNYMPSSSTASYQFGNDFVTMLRPDAYDYNLQWEKTSTTNIGLDFGFLKNRINGAVDVYQKYTYDLLGVVPIPAGTNFSNRVLTNVGQMSNRGIEANVNFVLVSNETSSFEIGVNGALNRNKILKLALVDDTASPGIQVGGISGGVGNTIQIHALNNPMFTYFGFEQRFDANGRPIEKSTTPNLGSYSGTVDIDGDGKISDIEAYVDQNGDGVINTADLKVFRNRSPEPRTLFGLSLNFTHKRWSGGATVRAELGQYVYNNVRSVNGNYFSVGGSQPHLTNLTSDFLESQFRTPQYLSSYYLENASYLRLDNLYLSYNLGKLYKDRFASSLNISMQNALVLTKYRGLDPEIAGGIDNNLYPRPRVFNIQLNVQL